jgi:hypothetical protein
MVGRFREAYHGKTATHSLSLPPLRVEEGLGEEALKNYLLLARSITATSNETQSLDTNGHKKTHRPVKASQSQSNQK